MNCNEITKKIIQMKSLKKDFDVAHDAGDKLSANEIKEKLVLLINEAKVAQTELTEYQKKEFHKLMNKIKAEVLYVGYYYNNVIEYLNKYSSSILESLKLTQINSIASECIAYYKPDGINLLISSTLSVFINKKINKDEKVVLNIKDTQLNNSLTRLGGNFSKGTLVIIGDVGSNLGCYMTGGKIIVEGNSDNFCGNKMENGTIEISGDTGTCCGYCMDNGTIKITGNTGEACGDGSIRGKIEVGGNIENIASDCGAVIYQNGKRIRN